MRQRLAVLDNLRPEDILVVLTACIALVLEAIRACRVGRTALGVDR